MGISWFNKLIAGGPKLPPNKDFLLQLNKISWTNLHTVDFPLVPVIAIIGAFACVINKSNSLITFILEFLVLRKEIKLLIKIFLGCIPGDNIIWCIFFKISLFRFLSFS